MSGKAKHFVLVVNDLKFHCIHCTLHCFIPSHIAAPFTVGSNCTHGALRLIGGSNHLEGRVEICINNAWGTICDNQFSSQDAEVICRQIGELPSRKCRYSTLAQRKHAYAPDRYITILV